MDSTELIQLSPKQYKKALRKLAVSVQLQIESFRKSLQLRDDGLCTICKHCWPNETSEILAYLQKHLASYVSEG